MSCFQNILFLSQLLPSSPGSSLVSLSFSPHLSRTTPVQGAQCPTCPSPTDTQELGTTSPKHPKHPGLHPFSCPRKHSNGTATLTKSGQSSLLWRYLEEEVTLCSNSPRITAPAQKMGGPEFSFFLTGFKPTSHFLEDYSNYQVRDQPEGDTTHTFCWSCNVYIQLQVLPGQKRA